MVLLVKESGEIMKTLYCDKCGKHFSFEKSKFYSYSHNCKKCGNCMEVLTCEKCNHSFVFTGIRKGPTNYIFCDECEYCIEATSDYGFGPTMPAMIFKGSRLLCHIKGARTFLDANNNKLDIKVPLEMQKGSLYTRIFTLCPYVAKYIMDKERAEKNED